MSAKLYAERDPEEQGDEYFKHLMAMTGEQLHSKAAIASELAHRDIQIIALKQKLEKVSKSASLHEQNAIQKTMMLADVGKGIEEKITQALYGIDKTEIEDELGYWETSVGAERGSDVLKRVINIIQNNV